jgi:hypothetical protein
MTMALAVAGAEDFAHGVADNAGHILSQRVDIGLESADFSVDLVETFLGSLPEFEETAMDAFDLFHEESEGAFKLAHAPLQVANLGFNIHAHAALYHNRQSAPK